jgi:CheY-like chemotaxis protein
MRILLVEDEPDVRAFLARALAVISPQASIVTAEDGRRALALFTSGAVDLVISDQHMPHLSGLELLQTIRRSSDVPFILISADSAVGEMASTAGASSFLAKPFALNALRRAVEALAPAV